MSRSNFRRLVRKPKGMRDEKWYEMNRKGDEQNAE
jgi:hypothetical protein